MTDNKIKVTFGTTAGDYEQEFPVNQPLKAIKRRVMAQLKLDPSKADELVVTLDGTELDESRTLAELGIDDCAVLLIVRRELVKI